MPIINKPKKIKIRTAIILILGRIIGELTVDVENGVNAITNDRLNQVHPVLDVDDSVWTYEQAAVWAAADAICDALDNECSDKSLDELSGILQDALNNL